MYERDASIPLQPVRGGGGAGDGQGFAVSQPAAGAAFGQAAPPAAVRRFLHAGHAAGAAQYRAYHIARCLFFSYQARVWRAAGCVFRKARNTGQEDCSREKNENITGEQLAALFRVSGGRITAEKLARAADVSTKAAKKVLDRQVIEGLLDVEAGDSELIYIKK
jgi:hypothetical protein